MFMNKRMLALLAPLFAGVFVLGGSAVFVTALVVFVIFVAGFDLLGRLMTGEKP